MIGIKFSKIIQIFCMKEINKVIDKYSRVNSEDVEIVETLIESIHDEELKEEFLNNWSKSLKVAKEIGENEVDDRIISLQ